MDTLEKKIREMNREILRLKTSQPLVAGFKTWWAAYELELEPVDPEETTTYYYEITYADGEQPILTEWGVVSESTVWVGMAVLESPVGNKQVIAFWDTGSGIDIHLWFSSTRQILSIRKIPAPS